MTHPQSRHARSRPGLASPRALRNSMAALLGATALAGMTDPAHGSDWTGGTNNDWFTASNWNSGVPDNTHSAVLGSGLAADVAIDGAAATAYNMYVGLFYDGNLLIGNGGTLTNSGFGNVGYGFLTYGAVTVTGAGSAWNIAAGPVSIGSGGTGIVTIENGGAFSSAGTSLGYDASGTGTVNVEGAGSIWTDTGQLDVGVDGNGTINLTNGGQLLSNIAYLGIQTGTGTVNVDNASWVLTGDLSVGYGSHGMLNITNGGSVAGTTSSIVGDLFGSTGEVLVSGAGSLWANGGLYIGLAGEGHLTIEDGGEVTATNINVTDTTEGSGEVTVTGAGSKLTSTDYLSVGVASDGAMVVSDGAVVTNVDGSLGYATTGNGLAAVTGAGSQWNNSGNLLVGNGGEGTLIVTDHGFVTSDVFVAGATANAQGLVGLSGASSAIDASSSAIIGDHGIGFLAAAEGGAFTVHGDLTIGSQSGGIGEIYASGSGTSLSADNLIIGDFGQGALYLTDGASATIAGAMTIAAQTGSNGYLSIGAATATAPGSLQAGSIVFGDGNGALILDHTGDFQLDPDIAGNGQIVQYTTGTGATDYNGNGSGFTGVTGIYGGRFNVANSLYGTTTVYGGTLGGVGTFETINAESGGTVAPGNSIGTMHTADVSFDAGSVYEVEVDSLGNSDLIDASGTATINGGIVDVVAYPDYATGVNYTILSAAGGVTGMFDGATFGNSAFIGADLDYVGNDVLLMLTQNATFDSVALTPNQKAAAGGANALGAGNVVFDTILGLDADSARDAFDQLSGEIHASVKGGFVRDSLYPRAAAFGRLERAFATPPAVQPNAYAEPAAHIGDIAAGRGAWGHLHGGIAHANGDGNAAALDRGNGGFIAGIDGDLNGWRVGAMAHAGLSRLSSPDRGSEADSADYGAGIYGGGTAGGLRISFGADVAGHSVSSTRNVDFGGFTDTLKADYGSTTGQAFLRVARPVELRGAEFVPFADIAHVVHRTAGFTETGGAASLTSAADTLHATFTTLGIGGTRDIAMGDGKHATANGSIGWRHAFGGEPRAVNSFAGGDAFTVLGTPVGRNTVTLAADVSFDIRHGLTANLGYDGEIGATGNAHTFSAGIGGSF